MMKRLFSLLMVTALLFGLTGCFRLPHRDAVSTPYDEEADNITTTTTAESTTTAPRTDGTSVQTETVSPATSTTVPTPSVTKNTTVTEGKTTTSATTVTTTTTITTTAATTTTTTTTKVTTTTVTPLRTDQKLSEVSRLRVGDVMVDFRTTDSDGNTVQLSELLQKKKVVVLNFWFTSCTWCVKEFPVMNEVYNEYEDKATILALDPFETTSQVKVFRKQHKLNFPMAACPASWPTPFGITSYPTTVVIDRNGVICMMQVGAVTDEALWGKLMRFFTADSYQTTLMKNGISDLNRYS